MASEKPKHKTGHPGGRTGEKQLARAENTIKVWQMRRAGYTIREIAGQIGVSKSEVGRLVKDALGDYQVRNQDQVDEYVALETGRIEAIMRAFMPKAQTGNASAADVVLKAHDRLAKMHGMDAPSKIAPTTPDGKDEFGGGIGLSALLIEARKAKG
jgi:hypothetical protein